MRVKRWASFALAGGTAAALVAVPTSAGAAGAQTLTVGVGGDTVIQKIVFEGMRFDAPPLQVHKGDTITFQFLGFHTVTLLPDDTNATDWRAQHMAPGGDYALIQPDADDTPPAFEFNKTAVLPSDPTCGADTQPACTYDGTSVVNSGLPVEAHSFSVTINDTAGKSFWVICLLHGMMQQKITVVPDGQPTTTQDQINSYAKTTLARDHDEAAALIPRLEKRTHHTTASGVKVWDAYGGFDGDGWGLDAMFPGTLRIQKGDRVRWHFAQLTGNIHTVTFPERQSVSFANDFQGQNVKCEASPSDTPPDAPPPTFCSSGIQNMELEIRANAIVPVGGTRYGGKGLFSSGIKGAEAGNTSAWTLRFVHRSGKHGFHYACNVHGAMMPGRVIVS